MTEKRKTKHLRSHLSNIERGRARFGEFEVKHCQFWHALRIRCRDKHIAGPEVSERPYFIGSEYFGLCSFGRRSDERIGVAVLCCGRRKPAVVNKTGEVPTDEV